MSHESRVTSFILIALIAIALNATGCVSAGLSAADRKELEGYRRTKSLVADTAKETMDSLAKSGGKESSDEEEKDPSASTSDAKPPATTSPVLPGPDVPFNGRMGSDYERAEGGQIQPMLAYMRPSAINQMACRARMIGAFVGHAQGSPMGDIYPMLAEDHSKPNECGGACLIMRNEDYVFFEIRMTAMDPARPGLAGRDAAVTLCNGFDFLSVAPVERDSTPWEYATLLPPGASVIIGPIVRTARITLIPYVKMPLGVVWPKGRSPRIKDITFPAPGRGYLYRIQPRAA